jgi:hypothetical protein
MAMIARSLLSDKLRFPLFAAHRASCAPLSAARSGRRSVSGEAAQRQRMVAHATPHTMDINNAVVEQFEKVRSHTQSHEPSLEAQHGFWNLWSRRTLS